MILLARQFPNGVDDGVSWKCRLDVCTFCVESSRADVEQNAAYDVHASRQARLEKRRRALSASVGRTLR